VKRRNRAQSELEIVPFARACGFASQNLRLTVAVRANSVIFTM
jgi:hypothetical protein